VGNLKVLTFSGVVTEWGEICVIRGGEGEIVESIGDVL
jgi:hypothetical protein